MKKKDTFDTIDPEVLAKELKHNQQEFETLTANMNEAEQVEFYNQIFSKYGTNTKQVDEAISRLASLPPFAPVSDIFNMLGWYPNKQVFNSPTLLFGFEDIIKFELVENGIVVHFVNDFGKTDRLRGWSQEDYKFDTIHNPPFGKAKQIAYGVKTPIHIGFSMLNVALNQVTRNRSLFAVIFNSIDKYAITPIRIEYFTARLGVMAADVDYTPDQPVDFATITPDYDIKVANWKEFIVWYQMLKISLSTSSRQNIPDRFKIFDQNLMSRFGANGFKLLAPMSLKAKLGIYEKAGLFNQEYAELGTEIISIDGKRTFEEFLGATNYLDGTGGKYTLRLLTSKFVRLISQFEVTQIGENYNLTSIFHFWGYYGFDFDVTQPYIRINLEITDESGALDVKLNGTPNIGGTVTVANQISGFATETTLATLNKEATQQTLMKDATGQTIATNTTKTPA